MEEQYKCFDEYCISDYGTGYDGEGREITGSKPKGMTDEAGPPLSGGQGAMAPPLFYRA